MTDGYLHECMTTDSVEAERETTTTFSKILLLDCFSLRVPKTSLKRARRCCMYCFGIAHSIS